MNSSLQTNWSTLFEKTVATLQQDENYLQYSAREKMLAFTFTFLQNMNEDSIYFSTQIQQQRFPFLPNQQLKELKTLFLNYSDALIFEGTNSGEIQARPLIANYYQQLLWNAIVSILYFWANDTSEQKENTDVMVEKTIHFTFDLLAPNAIDSGIDLVQHFLKLIK
jgi:hypothetical protein